MQKQNLPRTLLFMFFFSIGAAILAGAVLCDDLVRYYRSEQILRLSEESLNRLRSLNADYDALLKRLEEDPNLLERIAPATLGTEPADMNTVYPDVTAEQLDAVRKVLAENSRDGSSKVEVPRWLTRCSEPTKRKILFVSGGFLILISFICFSPVREKAMKEDS